MSDADKTKRNGKYESMKNSSGKIRTWQWWMSDMVSHQIHLKV